MNRGSKRTQRRALDRRQYRTRQKARDGKRLEFFKESSRHDASSVTFFLLPSTDAFPPAQSRDGFSFRNARALRGMIERFTSDNDRRYLQPNCAADFSCEKFGARFPRRRNGVAQPFHPSLNSALRRGDIFGLSIEHQGNE